MLVTVCVLINIRDRAQLHLKDYHDWFRRLVGDWIDIAASKSHDEIKRAVTSLDEVSDVYIILPCMSVTILTVVVKF